MAHVDINLLPSNYNIQKGVVDTSETLKKTFIIGAILLVILGILGLLATVFLNRQLVSQNASNTQLKSEIASIEVLEQRYFLVKDRITKLNQILKLRTMEQLVKDISALVVQLPPGSELAAIDIAASKTEVDFTVNSSQAAAQLLTQMAQNDQFAGVTLKNFQFSDQTGYKLSFELIK